LLVDNIHSIPVRFFVLLFKALLTDAVISDWSRRPATGEYSILSLPISRCAGGTGPSAGV
jgi:hypothetical protein